MWKLIKIIICVVGLLFFAFQPTLTHQSGGSALVIAFAIILDLCFTKMCLRWAYQRTKRKPIKRLYWQMFFIIFPNLLVQLYDNGTWTFVYSLCKMMIINLYYGYYIFTEEKRIRQRVRRVLSKFRFIYDIDIHEIVMSYYDEMMSDIDNGETIYPRLKIFEFTKNTFKFVYYNKSYTDMRVFYVEDKIRNFIEYYPNFRLKFYPEYDCYCFDLEHYKSLGAGK